MAAAFAAFTVDGRPHGAEDRRTPEAHRDGLLELKGGGGAEITEGAALGPKQESDGVE